MVALKERLGGVTNLGLVAQKYFELNFQNLYLSVIIKLLEWKYEVCVLLKDPFNVSGGQAA